MSNQRKDARKKLMSFAPVYDSASRSLWGYIGNINLNGVMVVGEHSAEVGKESILQIELPTSISEDVAESTLTMPSRVAWCKEEESAKSYTIGFEFKEITPAQEAVIQAILDKYDFKYSS